MDPSTLLEHREFVTSVARALLRHDADVEDAVQETYVAALQADPPRSGRVRPWLGGIARNVANGLVRRRARRRRRERAVARPERTAAQSTEKLRWQQRVVEEVLALDASYRDVLLLRYYEEMPPREIARRLDLPVNTVRTRTRRGLELLRKKFDARYGRNAWSLGLAALFATPAAAAGSGKLIAAALVAVLAGTAWIGHATLRDGHADPVYRAASREVARPAPVVEGRPVTKPENAEPAAPRSLDRLKGRLLVAGTEPREPLAGARVHLAHAGRGYGVPWAPIATANTDANGRFTIPWDPARRAHWSGDVLGGLELFAERDGRWTESFPIPREAGGDGFEREVKLLPNPRFRFVRERGGAPVAGTRVEWRELVDLCMPGRRLAAGITNADGEFEGEWPPYQSRVFIRAELPLGEILQWPLDQGEVRSYDPYVVSVHDEDVASVSVRVEDESGTRAAAGTHVVVRGVWAPDGATENEGHVQFGSGALSRPLLGRTDGNGQVVFRFPADRVRHGVYVPDLMAAWDESGRFVCRTVAIDATLAQVAGNRLGLPTLRFGAPDPPAFLLEGHPNDAITVHIRAPNGAVRCLDTSEVLRMPLGTVRGFPYGLPGPGEASVVLGSDDGFAWQTLSAAEFASCLSGRRVVRLENRAPAIKIRVRGPEDGTVTLESMSSPFLFQEWIGAGEFHELSMPKVRGRWRLRFGETTLEFDPAERAEIDLE